MQIGVVGLGRMGGNIARRLGRAGHRCVVYDANAEALRRLAAEGAEPADSLHELVGKLDGRRIVWVMLPVGDTTEETITTLAQAMAPGDIVIDGGNSFYKDDVRRAADLAKDGIHYLDVGTSGGVWGLDRGYCMMIGGEAEVVDDLDPLFAALAPGAGDIVRTPGRDGRDRRAEQGYIHAGPAGAGHFVKMVHNGIEYGLMAAYAEGFDVLAGKASDLLPEGERYHLNVADVAEVWRRGSVISSWLLDLCSMALAEDGSLAQFTGTVADCGEGRWTVMAAVDQGVPAHVLSAALFARFRSRQDHTFGDRLLSAMRFRFGNHVETVEGRA